MIASAPVLAVEAINVTTDAPAIDLTDAAERHRTEGDRILVSAAPGPDGIIRRMDVRAREGNTNWAVFALVNSGNEQIERLIVELEEEMYTAAEELRFEYAAKLRDEIKELRRELVSVARTPA